MPAPGPKAITEPHKELRFTRGAQGSLFALLGATGLGASVAMLLLNVIPKDPILSWWAPLVPLPPALLCLRVALHCVRHAYLILTPLGIEIFPFFRARRNLRLLHWSEITAAEINSRKELVLHFNEEKTSGVVASLAPLLPSRRILLERAIAGRMKQRDPSN